MFLFFAVEKFPHVSRIVCRALNWLRADRTAIAKLEFFVAFLTEPEVVVDADSELGGIVLVVIMFGSSVVETGIKSFSTTCELTISFFKTKYC